MTMDIHVSLMAVSIFDVDLWPHLLTWFNFNPNMDK